MYSIYESVSPELFKSPIASSKQGTQKYVQKRVLLKEKKIEIDGFMKLLLQFLLV